MSAEIFGNVCFPPIAVVRPNTKQNLLRLDCEAFHYPLTASHDGSLYQVVSRLFRRLGCDLNIHCVTSKMTSPSFAVTLVASS